jgi:hypothetical protein
MGPWNFRGPVKENNGAPDSAEIAGVAPRLKVQAYIGGDNLMM